MVKLPLVGPAYKLRAQSMSCQNCINWYPQTIEYPNGSRVAALIPTPGLKRIFEGDQASVRCLHVLSNGDLIAVIGKRLYHSKSSKFELVEMSQISALGTVRIADNGQVALIVNGTYTYALDMLTLTIERLSGSTIPRSTHVLFLDGRFVLNKFGTGQFYWSNLYSTKIDGLSYATAESTPDNITASITFNRELWLFGAQSVERYYGTGSSNAPFARLSGGAMAFGCVAPDSIVSLSTGVIWLGVSEFGGHQIVMSAGGIPERISTHAIEEAISVYSKTSDAMAYAYQQEGHVFYVISFPSANATFCFDVSTGLWHQRSFANAQGLHERHRSQHHAFFRNMHIVGDYRNGKLYDLDNHTFTDDGELILRERTAQAVNTEGALTRFNKLEIVCETGFGVEKKETPDPKPPEPIGCEGAIDSCTIGHLTEGGYYRVYVNDIEITESRRLLRSDEGSRSLSVILKDDFNVQFVPLNADLIQATDPFFNDVENGRFENLNDSYVKIRIITLDAPEIYTQFEPLNGSMQLTPRPEEGAAFCLFPSDGQIYPPYAVVDSNIEWGQDISVVLTINGKEITGNLLGDVADVLAHEYDIFTGFERMYSEDGDQSHTGIVFSGDLFASNAKLNIKFQQNVMLSINQGWKYPQNETLVVNGNTMNFNIGKLVCDMGVIQEQALFISQDYPLIYGKSYNLRVSSALMSSPVTTQKNAGAISGNPKENCQTAISPESCEYQSLIDDLMGQWNPELNSIGVKAFSGRHSQYLNPKDSIESGSFSTTRFAVLPTDEVPVDNMGFMGYVIPICEQSS